MTVNVRFPKNIQRVIDIGDAASVEDVKEAISKNSKLDPCLFDLLFCGKVLNSGQQIKSLNLGAGSVLHVIDIKHKKVQPDLSMETTSETSDSKRYNYNVYCKRCKDLQAGKLRVRCHTCQQGAIILSKEPGGWSDVLRPRQLEGFCKDCDGDQPAQFYFKCCNHDGTEECLPLHHVRPNTQDVECVICTEVRSPILVYPCPDQHVVCIDCFKAYAQTSLDQRTFIEDQEAGYSLSCPVGCENSLIHDVHHFQLLGKDQYERYKDFGAEECLLKSGGIFCPNPACGEGILVVDQAKSVKCHTCRLEFCRRCSSAVHPGECSIEQTAEETSGAQGIDTERALRSRWDAESLITIQQISKPCPHCGVNTERNGGCMHMKCSRCAGDWCWLCEKNWNRGCQGDHWFE